VPSCKMGPAQHHCPRLSLARHARVHSDLPYSTSPRADSPRSPLQLDVSSNELSFSSSCSRQLPPPEGQLQPPLPMTSCSGQLPPPTPVASRGRQLLPPPLDSSRLPPPVASCGQQLPPLPPVHSFCCRLMILVADSPCCRRRCLVQWTALAATACWCSF
jgi:hypothetical protein